MYATHWQSYRAAGWIPLPLPKGAKFPPPANMTGRGAVEPSEWRYVQWDQAERGKEGNIASRMPRGVIGIDVDATRGKPGADTFRELVARCGELPPHPVSSAADGAALQAGHGIHYFRLPGGWLDAQTVSARLRDPGPGVEVVRWEHRYAVMPPSLHPEGSRYRWYMGEMSGGEYSARPYAGEVPAVRELPVLPREWFVALLKRQSSLAAGDVIEGVEAVRYPITRAEAETKLRDALDAIRRAREGERNNTLARQGFEVARLAKSGFGDKAALLAELQALGESIGLGPDETRATILSQFNATHSYLYSIIEPLSADGNTEDDSDDDPVSEIEARIVTFAHLRDQPPPEWLVDGVLPKQGVGRIYGPSGSMKSFLVLHLLGAVGHGDVFAGRDCMKTSSLYVVAEGQSGIGKRVRAYERHHGRSLPGEVAPWPIQINGDSEWHAFVELASRRQWGLVVFDTQASSTVGLDENSATDMGKMVDRLRALSEATGGLVMLVHHTGYDTSHSRGSTAVYAGMDVELSVSKDGDSVVVRGEKVKDGDRNINYSYTPLVVETGVSTELFGSPETSVVLTEGFNGDRRIEVLHTTVRDVLRHAGEPLTAKEIWETARDEFGYQGRNRLLDALNALREGFVESTIVGYAGATAGRGKGHRYTLLADSQPVPQPGDATVPNDPLS